MYVACLSKCFKKMLLNRAAAARWRSKVVPCEFTWHQHVARLGVMDNIFSRPRPSLVPLEHTPWVCPHLRSKLTFPFFDDEVCFFCLCNPTWRACDSKSQPIKITQFFGTGTGYGKVKKNKAIFDSQEYERNALPNLRRWLTTSSRVINLSRFGEFQKQGC